jgi:hypothetical protein
MTEIPTDADKKLAADTRNFWEQQQRTGVLRDKVLNLVGGHVNISSGGYDTSTRSVPVPAMRSVVLFPPEAGQLLRDHSFVMANRLTVWNRPNTPMSQIGRAAFEPRIVMRGDSDEVVDRRAFGQKVIGIGFDATVNDAPIEPLSRPLVAQSEGPSSNEGFLFADVTAVATDEHAQASLRAYTAGLKGAHELLGRFSNNVHLPTDHSAEQSILVPQVLQHLGIQPPR